MKRHYKPDKRYPLSEAIRMDQRLDFLAQFLSPPMTLWWKSGDPNHRAFIRFDV